MRQANRHLHKKTASLPADVLRFDWQCAESANLPAFFEHVQRMFEQSLRKSPSILTGFKIFVGHLYRTLKLVYKRPREVLLACSFRLIPSK